MKKFSKRKLLSILTAIGAGVLASGLAVGIASQTKAPEVATASVELNDGTIDNGISTASLFNASNSTITIRTQSTHEVLFTNSSSTTLIVNAQNSSGERLVYDWYKSVNGGRYRQVQSGYTNMLGVYTNGISEKTTLTFYANIYPFGKRGEAIHSKKITVDVIPFGQKETLNVTKPKADKSTVKVGQEVTLSVSASSSLISTEGLKYQWFELSSNGSNWNRIDGATQSTYKVKPAEVGTKTFMVQVSGQNTTVQSDSVTVKVQPRENEWVKITGPKADKSTAKVGEEVTLSVSATSSFGQEVALKYQWFELSKDGSSWTRIQNATASTYTVSGNEAGTRTFMVQVTGETVTNESNSVSVTFQEKDMVAEILENSTTKPSSIKINAQSTHEAFFTNTSTTLIVNAESTKGERLVYDWYRSKDGVKYQQIQSGHTNMLGISGDSMRDITQRTTWTYYANIYPLGKKSEAVHSQKITLEIIPVAKNEKVEISELTVDKSTIKVGETAKLSVAATSSLGSTTQLKYQWFELSKDGSKWTRIENATASTYTVSATEAGTKTFMVQVSGNSVTTQSDNISVTIQDAPVTETLDYGITGYIDNWSTVASVDWNYNFVSSADTIQNGWFKANVDGGNDGYTFQWYWKDWNDFTGANLIKIDGATNSTYTPSSNVLRDIHTKTSGMADFICKVSKDGKYGYISDFGAFLRVVR